MSISDEKIPRVIFDLEITRRRIRKIMRMIKEIDSLI